MSKQENKDSKGNKENKKEKTKKQTILEVNEITEETVKADEAKKAEEEKERKEKEDKLRKEKINKTFKKLFQDYDINNIVRILMWVFFAIAAISINISVFRQSFSAPAFKVFLREDTIREVSIYPINTINHVSIDLESFDVSLKDSDTNNIVVRYSKKYDKKITDRQDGDTLVIEEKNKLFKLIRFDSSNNVMVIEIPRSYKGSLEVESKKGSVRLEKYQVDQEEINEDSSNNLYDSFFNI